jgi:hypothetical protein
MDELKKYQKVNQCETLEELALTIESFADVNGEIQGKTRHFNASKMAGFCRNFHPSIPELLTREFGIRQQAMYITHYIKKE